MKVLENFSLLHHNTFAMDVKAKRFVEYQNVCELKEVLGRFGGNENRDSKKLFIGRGSNLLFTRDFDGTVFHGNISGVEVVRETDDHVLVSVGAGVVWDDFVAWCVDNNLYGAENLSLIPGEVGAAAVQNIGAYGCEASDIIESVETVDVSGLQDASFSVSQCRYAYRRSFFKENPGKYVVHHVVFRLSRKFIPNLEYKALEKEFGECVGNFGARDIREYVTDMRKSKLPDPKIYGNAGSFFMNPIVSDSLFRELQKAYPAIPHYTADGGIKIPAAWLIQQCDWKGKRRGNAGVYEKQPLVIINCGGAKAMEIAELSQCVIDDVRQKFNITLKPEVQFI